MEDDDFFSIDENDDNDKVCYNESTGFRRVKKSPSKRGGYSVALPLGSNGAKIGKLLEVHLLKSSYIFVMFLRNYFPGQKKV